MTHMPGIPVKFDAPNEWKDALLYATREPIKCQKCKAPSVRYRTHTASDGGVEDDEFECTTCHYSWWIDGIDS
jgi:DNA-directed RNA polymerase subunit M/transcription elongation factor TFIIS